MQPGQALAPAQFTGVDAGGETRRFRPCAVPRSLLPMKLSELRLGMEVMHPQYGRGTVKAINEYAAEILFTDGRKPVDPEASSVVPAEAPAAVGPAAKPLPDVIRETVVALVAELGLESPDGSVNELGKRWVGGSMILKPADPGLQPKEVELDVFFHKLVMMRNQLRVLEQKINSSETLTSAEKFDWQQYITRCYGSMTTFNLLFKDKAGQFGE
jgi:hypothetical protein